MTLNDIVKGSAKLVELTDSYGKGKGLDARRALGRLTVRMYRRHWQDDPRPHVSLYVTEHERLPLERHATICLDRTQVPRLIRALARFMKETGK